MSLHRGNLPRVGTAAPMSWPLGGRCGDDLAQLVARAAQGDNEAIRRLVERFTPAVRGEVRRAGVFGADADDILQETWLRMVLGIGSLRDPYALPGWLRVTAGRLCLNLFRTRGRTVLGDSPIDGATASDPCWEAVDRAETAAILTAAVARLSDRDRRLIEGLAGGLSYREISAAAGIPIGSIGPTRERLLRKLHALPALQALTGPLSSAA